MKRIKGAWLCSSKCPECDGKGMIATGQEGFINRQMEQDVRDTYSPCPNAEYDEPDYPDRRDE